MGSCSFAIAVFLIAKGFLRRKHVDFFIEIFGQLVSETIIHTKHLYQYSRVYLSYKNTFKVKRQSNVWV